MDAPTNSIRRPSFILALVVSLALAACTGPAARVTIPPDATQSIAPATSATPAPSLTASPPPFPVTLTDNDGTEITIPEQPEAIVSLTPAATEILFAIGVGDRVVAKVEDITPYPPAADDLPIVATYQGVDVERIVDLEADLVIAGGVNFNQGDAIDQLRRLDVPVLVLYPADTESAFGGIELIGDATGAGKAARDLTAAMEAAFDQVGSATADLPKPRVFYEIEATDTIFTPSANSVYGEMLALAGSEPILTDDSYVISLEELLAADPEIILLGNPAATPDDVRARPGWSGMTAVKDGAIYPVNDTIITRPGPRLVDGLRELALAIHPDLELPEASPLAMAVVR